MSLFVLASDVTSWPREGVTLLVILLILFIIAAVAVNLRGGVARPASRGSMSGDQDLDLIEPPIVEAEDKELELRDV